MRIEAGLCLRSSASRLTIVLPVSMMSSISTMWRPFEILAQPHDLLDVAGRTGSFIALEAHESKFCVDVFACAEEVDRKRRGSVEHTDEQRCDSCAVGLDGGCQFLNS